MLLELWNRIKADINYLMMEMTKITDRVGILESETNDETEETKSVGAVHIEQLHIGKLFWQFITMSRGPRLSFFECRFQAYPILFNLNDMEMVDRPMIIRIK